MVDDFYKSNLNEFVCHLKCLSDALSRLYGDGQKRLFVNEGVYASASRICDDMEGKTGEDVKYLSVIGGSMEGKHDKLEKLISYGNTMGNLVPKVGGLFAEVNESVWEVRNALPTALLTANKYSTAIAEITRTVWDDVKGLGGAGECEDRTFKKARALPTACAKQMCPLRDSMSKDAVQKYRDGCLAVTVQNGSVSECLNKPRDNAYKNGAVKNSGDVLI
uniref:ESAG1 protein n=1 Tax=Trypanosoma brucei TaxID=5691 RepID=Q8MPG2_9TRYP|nr:ESAG1 protein [Trypanosoma brucei]